MTGVGVILLFFVTLGWAHPPEGTPPPTQDPPSTSAPDVLKVLKGLCEIPPKGKEAWENIEKQRDALLLHFLLHRIDQQAASLKDEAQANTLREVARKGREALEDGALLDNRNALYAPVEVNPDWDGRLVISRQFAADALNAPELTTAYLYQAISSWKVKQEDWVSSLEALSRGAKSTELYFSASSAYSKKWSVEETLGLDTDILGRMGALQLEFPQTKEELQEKMSAIMAELEIEKEPASDRSQRRLRSFTYGYIPLTENITRVHKGAKNRSEWEPFYKRISSLLEARKQETNPLPKEETPLKEEDLRAWLKENATGKDFALFFRAQYCLEEKGKGGLFAKAWHGSESATPPPLIDSVEVTPQKDLRDRDLAAIEKARQEELAEHERQRRILIERQRREAALARQEMERRAAAELAARRWAAEKAKLPLYKVDRKQLVEKLDIAKKAHNADVEYLNEIVRWHNTYRTFQTYDRYVREKEKVLRSEWQLRDLWEDLQKLDRQIQYLESNP